MWRSFCYRSSRLARIANRSSAANASVAMQAVIDQIRGDQAAMNLKGQGGATPDWIIGARSEVRTRLGATLPDDFETFLALCNGIDHNGAILYGATQSMTAPGPEDFWQGIVAANAAWRSGPGHEHYLVLGETDMDLLTVDLDGTGPVLRDKVSSDINEHFHSVADAIRSILERRW